MILELLMISIIVCFVIDVSGIVDSIKELIWKWAFNNKRQYNEFRLKPFDCSLCMCFWVGLLWLVVQSNFTLFNVMMVCLFAALTEQITNGIIIIKQMIAKIQDLIFEFFNK